MSSALPALWEDSILHLIRDIANPTTDALYPSARHKDWFDGHSWAAGLFPFADSRNQESTSEAVNAYYAVSLYGEATGDARLRDVGRLLMATEIRAAQTYWQITPGDTIYPPPFSENRAVGILWANKVDFATFFGANLEFVYGIQMIPFTPISQDLLPESWISTAFDVFKGAIATASEDWRALLIMAWAIIDADAAWDAAVALKAFDSGNSRANMLYWIATRCSSNKTVMKAARNQACMAPSAPRLPLPSRTPSPSSNPPKSAPPSTAQAIASEEGGPAGTVVYSLNETLIFSISALIAVACILCVVACGRCAYRMSQPARNSAPKPRFAQLQVAKGDALSEDQSSGHSNEAELIADARAKRRLASNGYAAVS
uniref:glucan endo-1,3-beta-D-glucosidase n=1 Tax=Chrysotila carterae TaxID=13221 RepID=A0A7S4BMV7_CHRCT